MLKSFLAVATILSLSAVTAMAEPTQVKQQMHIASTHADIRSSNEIGNRSPFATTEGKYPWTATGTHATQPTDSDPEPESISGGTEP